MANSYFKRLLEVEIDRDNTSSTGSRGYQGNFQAQELPGELYPGKSDIDTRFSKPDTLAACSPDPLPSRKRSVPITLADTTDQSLNKWM